MRSEGFPFTVSGSGDWTCVRVESVGSLHLSQCGSFQSRWARPLVVAHHTAAPLAVELLRAGTQKSALGACQVHLRGPIVLWSFASLFLRRGIWEAWLASVHSTFWVRWSSTNPLGCTSSGVLRDRGRRGSRIASWFVLPAPFAPFVQWKSVEWLH